MPGLLIILVIGFFLICSRSSAPGKTFLRMLIAMAGVVAVFLLLALIIPSRAEAFGTMAAVGGSSAQSPLALIISVHIGKQAPILPGKIPKL